MIFNSVVYILPALFYLSFSLDTPCSQEQAGGECLFDEECHGENTICKNGRCTCPTGFEHFALDEKNTVCRPAPDRIQAECQSECKPPLLCRSGKCECWQGRVDRSGKCRVTCERGKQLIGQDCLKVSRLGTGCTEDRECIDPFTLCRGNRCVCAPGTRFTGSGCVALCPSGHPATQSCRRLFVNDLDILIHKSRSDSCPPGYQCLAYGKPALGHCCPLYCPYGTADTSRSCDPGAPLNQRCRKLTHFCHTQSAPGWKAAVCCPRPCREPTPLYIGGRCRPIAHRDQL